MLFNFFFFEVHRHGCSLFYIKRHELSQALERSIRWTGINTMNRIIVGLFSVYFLLEYVNQVKTSSNFQTLPLIRWICVNKTQCFIFVINNLKLCKELMYFVKNEAAAVFIFLCLTNPADRTTKKFRT